jgi:hypothetical protein
MTKELIPRLDVVATVSEAEHFGYGLPDLTQVVINFIRYFPNRFHYVLSATPDATREMLRHEFPLMPDTQLQVVHPFVGTVGWVSREPNRALSSMVLLNDPGSFNQVCSRLRHEDAVFYVWAKFSMFGMNGSLIQAMSPHLFRRSNGDLHLYTGLNDIEVMKDLPSVTEHKLLEVNNGDT